MFLLILQHARQNLFGFMFRHGHFKDACMLFFPLSALPPPLQTSSLGSVSSSSSPQRTDPLATEYGTIESLCEFCVGYGAVSSLEEVIIERLESAKHQDQAINQYIAGALTRICVFFETNRHFNYLYKFLVRTFLLSWFLAYNLLFGCFHLEYSTLCYTNYELGSNCSLMCCMSIGSATQLYSHVEYKNVHLIPKFSASLILCALHFLSCNLNHGPWY